MRGAPRHLPQAAVGRLALVSLLVLSACAADTLAVSAPTSVPPVIETLPPSPAEVTIAELPSTTVAPSSTTTTSTTVPPTTTTAPPPFIAVPPVLDDVAASASESQLPPDQPAWKAAGDGPILYENGCHVTWNAVVPKEGCFYGDVNSPTLVAVTGDSHAAAWFGALDAAGKANHWKIVMVTKQGCPAANVTVYSAQNPDVNNVVYTACDQWRPNALAYINSLHPALVVFPMLSRRTVVGRPGPAGLAAWRDGLGQSIDTVRFGGAKALVIGDVPKMTGDKIPECLNAHKSNIGVCGVPRAAGVKQDRIMNLASAANEHGASFVDVSNWFCTDSFCPPVINGIVVYRDEHHLTGTYSAYRAPQIADVIRAALATK